MYFNLDWLREELLHRQWYRGVAPAFKELEEEGETKPEEFRLLKSQIYDVFEQALLNGSIALGNEIGIWDKERVEVDTVVIHHTHHLPNLSSTRLSAIELLRLYMPIYANPKTEEDKRIVLGNPVSSGHVRGDKQVFWPYHWMIHEGGAATRLLRDSEVGWQAGDWETNCKSVAICFDGDYEHRRPSDPMLQSAARLITRYNIDKLQVLGHCEVNKKTVCPSRLFLFNPEIKDSGWKQDLLEMIPEPS